MSASVEFQKLVFERLSSELAIEVYDNVPVDAEYPYASFGPSDATFTDADCLSIREETLQIDFWYRDHGRKSGCKTAIDAAKKALHRYKADMGVNALVMVNVALIKIIPDMDPTLTHGILQVTGTIEERE